MFDKMQNMMKQFELMKRLMKDENFKAFIAHPKVQALMQDVEFKEIAKTQDFYKMMSHPKFSSMLSDPDLAQLLSKINPKDLAGG